MDRSIPPLTHSQCQLLTYIHSKRAFQTQFKRWGFPSKQNPAHKNTDLVNRVRQLWETNTTQRDMLRILNEEGFEIKERELMRVRAKNRWLLRVPNGMKTQSNSNSNSNTQPHVQPQPEDEGLLALQQEVYKNAGPFENNKGDILEPEPEPDPSSTQNPLSPVLSPDAMAKRKERLERLKEESAERWAARKRRRRTRGWAGLPADPPGPPRFPSETTIDESKRYLDLDNAMYRQIRDQFQRICQEAGFLKKTVAGSEKWQEAKDRLAQESPHLRQVFAADSDNLDAKGLALDVVCTDVTKRMRNIERRMTIAEAKNALGINPEESRQLRNAFYSTLKSDHFTSKLEAGDEHWKELKDRWIQSSQLLQQILSPGPADPEYAMKLKAVEVLCRDVMKRLRDDQSKGDSSRTRSSSHNDTGLETRENCSSSNTLNNGISNGISTLASQALASAPMTSSDINDMQIDPSLLQAANDPAIKPGYQPVNSFAYEDPVLDPPVLHTPVYLRVSPQSQSHGDSKTWAEKMVTRSVAELRQLATTRFPASTVDRIEGVDKGDDGDELTFLVDEDHELDAYLTHVQNRKASFVFYLSEM